MGSVITVQIGTPPTPFIVHESLVVARSGFFKGALNGYFKESHTRTVELPEDDRWLFTCVIHWLYTGTLKMVLTSESEAGERVNLTSNNPNTQDQNDQEQDDECSSSFPKFLSWNRRVQQLFELWIYADKLQLPDLQNDLITKLIELSEGTSDWMDCTPMPSDETMEFVYDNTLANSPLRRLAVDLSILTRLKKDLEDSLKNLSDDIVRDISITTVRMWRQETHDQDRPRAYLTRALYNTVYNVGEASEPPRIPSLAECRPKADYGDWDCC